MVARTANSNEDVPQGKGLLSSKYARSKKALMATINEIRATGAAVDVDLPTIVVAGNQSSGKSSLIEAISGINLPRAVGTCTRVPIEVRLRQDEVDWNCVIKVRREGSDQDQAGADGHKPETPFGKPIIDPSLVESSIRRAQLGVLNPSVQLDRFVNYVLPKEEEFRPLGSEKQYAFSKDVIVLEITGPDQTDLTLVDMPGIIQNVGENEDKGNILLIENMVKSYIGKDCLILLVITMKDDVQNQKAALLAREADPDGKRTIGVLTKVDTVQGHAETQDWLKVVQNQKEKLNHGYYPNADALAAKITFADAREAEDVFFRDQAPWKDLSPQFKKRLGTKNLAAFLSDQLSFFIKTRLPELEKQISDRHREIEAELARLGQEPSEDSTGALLTLLTNFENSISKYVDGEAEHEGFMQELNDLFEGFKDEIIETKPKFVSKQRASDGGDKAMVGKDALEHVMANSDAKVYLDDIRLHIKGEIPRSALHKLIKRFTSTWEELALGLAEEVKPVLKDTLEGLIQEVFGKYTYGGLPGSVNTIINDHLADLFRNIQEQIKKQVKMERRHFTLNHHYLNQSQHKALTELRSLKRKRGDDGPAPALSFPAAIEVAERKRVNEERKRAHDEILSKLAAVGMPGIKEEELEKLRPADDWEVEMELMSKASAYWKVAFKRIIDNIPRCIDLELLAPLFERIRNALIAELKVFGDDSQARCREYLDEAPDVAEHRKDLTVRRARLGDAKVAIRKFKMK